MKVVAVGFKVAEENSVYYKKLKNIKPDEMNLSTVELTDRALGFVLRQAHKAGAEFVSVRFIKEDGE